MIALDEAIGEEPWGVDTIHDLAMTSSVVAGDVVYAGSRMGTLYAVGGTSA